MSEHYIRNYQKIPIEKRIEETSRILRKYPNRIPIMVERADRNSPHIDKHKYIVPCDISFGEFAAIIRPRIKLSPSEAIFYSINSSMPVYGNLLSNIYQSDRHNDGFLYVEYRVESTFG